MKIGMFSDSHYSSAELLGGIRRNNQSLRKIKEAYQYFAENQCDLVICLGDVIDQERDHQLEILHLQDIADVMKAYRDKMRTIVLMGNHDGFTFRVDDYYRILGEDCRPETISADGKTLLFLDACYFKNGKHYAPGDSDWTDTYYPHTDELSEQLSALSDSTVYVFMHQNIDPTVSKEHRLFNDALLREMFEKSGVVNTVFQGHYHPGNETEVNGIRYIAFPAMCENEACYFIHEL